MPLKDPEARKAYDRWRSKKRKAEGYKAPAVRLAIEK